MPKKKNLKRNRGIGVIWTLRYILPRYQLSTVYKCFLRHNFNYCEVIYDQSTNESFCNRIGKKVQCNSALTITVAITETSQIRISKKLRPESIKVQEMVEKSKYFRYLNIHIA